MQHISIHAPREGSDFEVAAFSKSDADFYPRSPRGERRRPAASLWPGRTISIHAPREGSDPGLDLLFHPFGISIHAPREGSDH